MKDEKSEEMKSNVVWYESLTKENWKYLKETYSNSYLEEL